MNLAEPVGTRLKAAMQAGDDASDKTAALTDPAQLDQARDRIEKLAVEFKSLSAALIPLREEAMDLEQTRNNLADWKRSVHSDANVILRTLVVRAVALAIALVILIAISEIWRRATFKYVHDARRRRQFLVIRRFATTILMGLVIVMGFVSDFSSLATYAGLITAGIAVALQTIILSVAAYFFLVGRYGVRVGDRVTVSGVTGDVIDIGLVRVFLMELAGTGVDLHPTGRVVVLANSALFSNTPLYKQLPGTDYAWHELYVTMASDTDTAATEQLLLKAVNTVYGGYKTSIERQHGALERLVDYKTDLPVPSCHVRLTDSAVEVVIRYPAEIRRMSEIDEQVTKEVLAELRGNEELRKAMATLPRIRSAVKS
jgi:small-conductance mechanosensitive channel